MWSWAVGRWDAAVVGAAGQPGGRRAEQQHFLRAAHFWCCRAVIAAPEEVGKHSLGFFALAASVSAQLGCFWDRRKGLGWEDMSRRVSGLFEPNPSWIVPKITSRSLR